MKTFAVICAAALATTSMATPTFAQSVAPANTNFTATGTAVLNKTGFPTQNCNLSLSGNSGSGTSGTITGGTNTGPGFCAGITVDPSTFTINSTVNSTTVSGTIDLLTVNLAGAGVICSEANLPFTVDTSGNIVFDHTIAPDCSVQASLNTPSVHAVP